MTAPKSRTTLLAAKRLTAAACALPLVAFGAVACGDDSADTAESVASEIPTTMPGGDGDEGNGGDDGAAVDDGAAGESDASGENGENGDASDDGADGDGDSNGPAEPVPSTTVEGADGTEVSIDDESILAAYAVHNYDEGYLGKPLGPVVTLAGGGKFITLEGGSIYQNPESGESFVVQGDIGDFWGEQGHETGPLGYPTGNETRADGGGLQQTFTGGTLIYQDGEVTEQQ